MPATNPLRKAAVLLASLPDGEAAFLLSQLSYGQLEKLARATRQLDRLRTQEQQQLAMEIASRRSAVRVSSTPPVNDRRTRDIELMEAADPHVLSAIVLREHPQSIATVLAHLSPRSAASLLRRLPTDQQLAATCRLSCPGTADAKILDVLFASIAWQVFQRTRTLGNPDGGETAVAQIINRTDPATERALLSNLAAEDRGLADRILQRMYVLRDLHRPWQQSSSSTLCVG